MLNVNICVGSSCHLKGSYDILQRMKAAIAEYKLEDKVNLSASFCLGNCTDGVSVRLNEDIHCGVSTNTFDEFFQEKILSNIKTP